MCRRDGVWWQGPKNSYMKYNILKINQKEEYREEEEWVTDQMNLNCNTGIPISMEYPMQLLRQHVVLGKIFDALLKSSKDTAPEK